MAFSKEIYKYLTVSLYQEKLELSEAIEEAEAALEQQENRF